MSLTVRIVSSVLLIGWPFASARTDYQPFQVPTTFCGPKLSDALKLVCATFNNGFDSSPAMRREWEQNGALTTHRESDQSKSADLGGGVVDECCKKSCTLNILQNYCHPKNLNNYTDDEMRKLNNLMNLDELEQPVSTPSRDISSPEDDVMHDMTILYVDFDYEPMVTSQSYSSPYLAAYLYDAVDVLPVN